MGRRLVFIGMFGALVLACEASAQEQALDCYGIHQGHPDCVQTDIDPNPHRPPRRNGWRNGHASRPPPTISGDPSGGGGPRGPRQTVSEVRAARPFVSPGQYPPEQFAAYGIVAFPATANPATRGRYLMVCREYWAALSASSDLAVPLDQQMVTVWPVRSAQTAEYLSAAGREESCEKAVADYHLGTAQTALRHAEIADGEPRNRRGPYLLAWAPPSEKGHEGALVLSIDLSSASAPEHFAESFQRWRQQIEQQPELWEQGWSVEVLRDAIRDWVDHVGTKIATLSSK
jgi:hypothetical protein